MYIDKLMHCYDLSYQSMINQLEFNWLFIRISQFPHITVFISSFSFFSIMLMIHEGKSKLNPRPKKTPHNEDYMDTQKQRCLQFYRGLFHLKYHAHYLIHIVMCICLFTIQIPLVYTVQTLCIFTEDFIFHLLYYMCTHFTIELRID